jgi:hypothetical protein
VLAIIVIIDKIASRCQLIGAMEQKTATRKTGRPQSSSAKSRLFEVKHNKKIKSRIFEVKHNKKIKSRIFEVQGDLSKFIRDINSVKSSGKWRIIEKVYPSVAKRKRYTDASVTRKPQVELDARSFAVLEGVRIAQEDLREAGGVYNLDEVRTLMHGVSRQAIDKRVQDGNLLAVPGPSNRRIYPTLQFKQDGSVVEGLRVVCAALPTSNPWTILNFLARPDDRLDGRTPIDVLKAGDVDLVVEAARRLGQQGA